MPNKYFVGVDIGGTFTDVVLVQEHSHRLFTSKKLTTPSEPGRAVIDAIEEAMSRLRPRRLIYSASYMQPRWPPTCCWSTKARW